MNARTLALSILVLVTVSACQGSGPGTVRSPADSGAAVAPPPTTTDAIARGGEVPADLLAAILGHAAERTGESADDFEVVTAEVVSWNDGSLGCPEPGQMYTQALVDGYHIVVAAADQRLDYRAANGGFRICSNPSAEVPPTDE